MICNLRSDHRSPRQSRILSKREIQPKLPTPGHYTPRARPCNNRPPSRAKTAHSPPIRIPAVAGTPVNMSFSSACDGDRRAASGRMKGDPMTDILPKRPCSAGTESLPCPARHLFLPR